MLFGKIFSKFKIKANHRIIERLEKVLFFFENLQFEVFKLDQDKVNFLRASSDTLGKLQTSSEI